LEKFQIISPAILARALQVQAQSLPIRDASRQGGHNLQHQVIDASLISQYSGPCQGDGCAAQPCECQIYVAKQSPDLAPAELAVTDDTGDVSHNGRCQ
jgi:hypothetical protein